MIIILAGALALTGTLVFTLILALEEEL